MINSHLLYRLSYRGTTRLSPLWRGRITGFPLQRRAILRFQPFLSSTENSKPDKALQLHLRLLYLSDNCDHSRMRWPQGFSQDSP